MEEVHGVDVSWLHQPAKALGDGQQQKKPTHTRERSKSSPSFAETGPKPETRPPQPPAPKAEAEQKTPSNGTNPTTPTTNGRASQRRPSLLRSNSTEEKSPSRKPSWMTSLSSKFSSQERTSQLQSVNAQAQPPSKQSPAVSAQSALSNETISPPAQSTETSEPYIPAKPNSNSGFFSSLTRRLSSASQNSTTSKASGNVGRCPRRVLNVDPNRERCQLRDVNPSKLRRVAFCVDVEIAGAPRYTEDAEDGTDKSQKKKEAKIKERAEGEALKNPDALIAEKEHDREPDLEKKSKSIPIPGKANSEASKETPGPGVPVGSVASTGSLGSTGSIDPERDAANARKREKKKRSEEERKERKEKRRRKAEESGSIPMEVTLDEDDEDGNSLSSSVNLTGSLPDAVSPQKSQVPPPPPTKRPDRPTTEPVRIYRRCCQLRESPILKRITEQLMAPNCCAPHEPGVVSQLDLRGSRLQTADFATLGDWLAVVPVKRLILEDADISDEGLRCVLAGLLAAKQPVIARKKPSSPKHRQGIPTKTHTERTGVIEKLNMKNNPRVSATGWKYIFIFVHMCRSVRALDLSMLRFPSKFAGVASGQEKNASSQVDAAEAFSRSLSQRLGDTLEELILTECGFASDQIDKIIDGVVSCRLQRLGLAGNALDDDGLRHVIRYVQSGHCQGLDLGSNDMRGRLGILADALAGMRATLFWGLSLADCNLDSASLKPLWPSLQRLNNFRFLDLSHNRDLCVDVNDNTTITLLRKYLPVLQNLKRIHLRDIGMSSRQAIALADVLPEGPSLAHINLLDNPKLTVLANATTEVEQEEAFALYASLMAAVRCSNTLICIDIDVPAPENSEVVKALAKQVVAYSLRNMEKFAFVEATGTELATSQLTSAYGGAQNVKDVTVPDVLMRLVGQVEGVAEDNHDDEPAPDEDYMVGGAGVVKALQYVLGEKSDDLRRTSVASTPVHNSRRGSEIAPSPANGTEPAGEAFTMKEAEQRVKAKKMSTNLLESARKIRQRLQPALAREAATGGDEMAIRRLLFLDSTLQSMIQRFEEEYPETRLQESENTEQPGKPSIQRDVVIGAIRGGDNAAAASQGVDLNVSDDDEADSHPNEIKPSFSRHNSDVSLASRALSLEEGHLHRIGHQLRREIVDGSSGSPGSPIGEGHKASHSRPGTSSTADGSVSIPDSTPTSPVRSEAVDSQAPRSEQERLDHLREKIEGLTGPDLKALVERTGWEDVLTRMGANLEDLRTLQEQDPEAWEVFKESQIKARRNVKVGP